MVHAARLPARVPGFIEVPRLDFNRILGYATAIAVHAVLFLLLLVPITAPPATTPGKPPPVWIIPVREIPPPPPPTPVPVVQHPTHPSVTPRPAPPQQPPVVIEQARAMDAGTTVTPPSATDAGDDVLSPQPPRAGMQLEYAQAPAPAYPRDALRDGAAGTVLLRVLVDVDGRPLDVRVERSSGNRSLDRAAREQVLQRWRFRPAMQDGRAVQAIGLVPVDFRLN